MSFQKRLIFQLKPYSSCLKINRSGNYFITESIEGIEEIESINSGVEALNNNGYAYAMLEFDNTVDDYFPIIDELRNAR